MDGLTAIALTFTIIDSATRPMKGISASLENTTGKLKSFSNAISKAREPFKNWLALSDAGFAASERMIKGLVRSGALAAGPVMSAEEFNQGLAEAAAMAGESIESFKNKYSDTVLQLSLKTGVSTTELIAGMKQGISEGMKSDDIMIMLDAQAKASVAGAVDLSSAMELGTKITKAYSLPMQDIIKMNDVITASVQKGGAGYAEVSKQLDKVIVPAGAAGVSLQNLQAAAMQLTLSGVKVDKAYAGVAGAIQAITAPTASANAAFARLGVAVNADELRKGDLIGIMELLSGKLKGLSAAEQNAMIGQIFSNSDAQAFARDYLANGEKYKKMNLELMNSEGMALKTFEDMRRQNQNSFKELKNALNVLGVTLGNTLLPALGKLAGFIRAVATPMADFLQKHKTLAAVLGGVVVAIMGLVAAFMLVTFAVGYFLKVMAVAGMVKNATVAFWGWTKAIRANLLCQQLLARQKLAGVFKAFTGGAWSAVRATLAWTAALLTNPITWVVIGIVALIAALVALQKKFNIFGKLFGFLKGAGSVIGSFFSKFNPFKGIGEKFTAMKSKIAIGASGLFKDFKADPAGVMKQIGLKLLSLNPMVMLGKAMLKTPLFKGVGEKLKEGLKSINLLGAGKQMIDELVNGILSGLPNISGIVEGIKGFFGSGKKDMADVKDFTPAVDNMASSSVSNRSVDNSINIEFTPSYGAGAAPGRAEEDTRALAKMIDKERQRQARLAYGEV